MSKMLSSWKEIAHFFGKGVRTVQRWEKTLDLPIHRPAGAPSNVVLARTSDLEEWMHRGPVARAVAQEETISTSSPALLSHVDALENEILELAAATGNNVSGSVSGSVEERISSLGMLVSRVRQSIASSQTSRAA